jgi:hypothetical protein
MEELELTIRADQQQVGKIQDTGWDEESLIEESNQKK